MANLDKFILLDYLSNKGRGISLVLEQYLIKILQNSSYLLPILGGQNMPGNFKFFGFEPTDDLKTFSKEIFWLVDEKAPSQSAKTASLSKADNAFSAHIKIHSSSGIFEADAQNSDAKVCIEQVYSKTKDLLRVWAKSRVAELDDGKPRVS